VAEHLFPSHFGGCVGFFVSHDVDNYKSPSGNIIYTENTAREDLTEKPASQVLLSDYCQEQISKKNRANTTCCADHCTLQPSDAIS